MWRAFVLALLVGAFAQFIDGALGMAYGVTSNSFLLVVGLTPAIASASVHTAEVFTTLASGVSHFRVGNVDKKLFKRERISVRNGSRGSAQSFQRKPRYEENKQAVSCGDRWIHGCCRRRRLGSNSNLNFDSRGKRPR